MVYSGAGGGGQGPREPAAQAQSCSVDPRAAPVALALPHQHRRVARLLRNVVTTALFKLRTDIARHAMRIVRYSIPNSYIIIYLRTDYTN